jgi:xylan 1,4-beta-xylosidase
VEQIRFHGIFDDDMSVMSNDGSYNWYNVDLVYDYMLSLGVRPYVELSFMPSALVPECAEDRNNCDFVETTGIDGIAGPGSYKALENAPGDYEDWNKSVRLFAEHMVERHGLAEVSTWRFEVWNELWGGMDYFPGDLDSPYLHLYNASAVALKNVSPLLQVGGPATAKLQFIPDFIADISALGWPLDFVSTHSYPSDVSDGYPCTSAGNTDPDCFAHTVQSNRDIVAAAGLPFYISEYKEGLQGGPEYGSLAAHADTAYAASFILRNIPLLEGVDIFSWWTFTDVFEEFWMRGIPFSGGFGLLTTQGVAKPAYRALQLLNDAGSVRLPLTALEDPSQDYPDSSTVSAFGTCDDVSEGRCTGIQVFAANFGPMEGSTGEGNE